MLRIEIIRSVQALQPLRHAWDRLYQGGKYTIFQSASWNLLAARIFADRAHPMIIHAESENGAAIIPACVAGGCIYFLGDVLFDYRDTMSAGDEEVLRRAWQQVAAEHWPLSVTAIHGQQAPTWERLGFSLRTFANAPGVRCADISADEFEAKHSRSVRLLRRLARDGVELRSHQGNQVALVRHIYESKAHQSPDRCLFSDSARVEFMVAIAGQDPRCEIYTLETAGTLVAALVTFRDQVVRRFYTIYHDHRWADHSPGVALIYEVTRRSLAEGLDCDYMTGEQSHKLRFATHSVPLFRSEATPQQLLRIAHCREGNISPLAA